MARFDDIAIAKTVCDYFISRRVYGQGIDTTNDAGLDLYQRGGRLSTMLTLQNNSAHRTSDQIAYWKHIGDRQQKEPAGSGLWCDGSAGIIISLLSQRSDFKSKLEVIKQGDPTLHGHWWVLANRPDGVVLDFGADLHNDCFVIDIWGAIRGKLASSVVYNPPAILYDCGEDNSLEIVCTVAAK
ncbi:hypothetical protein ACJJIF_06305 [Microbulbifer sp. SSSA002]|uniref:hypothetical protein n=1 Tax=Microbulbifer sp. SSSA002 TaxID=3243376 RepID=UPI00403A590A